VLPPLGGELPLPGGVLPPVEGSVPIFSPGGNFSLLLSVGPFPGSFGPVGLLGSGLNVPGETANLSFMLIPPFGIFDAVAAPASSWFGCEVILLLRLLV
jgi:hypothetical protein